MRLRPYNVTKKIRVNNLYLQRRTISKQQDLMAELFIGRQTEQPLGSISWMLRKTN